jgi:hypothetical protein
VLETDVVYHVVPREMKKHPVTVVYYIAFDNDVKRAQNNGCVRLLT